VSHVVPSPGPSPAACRAPVYGPRLSSREPLLPERLPYAPPHRCRSWRCSGCALLKAKDARKLARVGVVTALLGGLTILLAGLLWQKLRYLNREDGNMYGQLQPATGR